MGLLGKYFGPQTAVQQAFFGGPEPALEAEFRCQQAAQQMGAIGQSALQQNIGITTAEVYDHMADMLRYPVQPHPLWLSFREVEGGYLAAYALAQGEVYKEVLCATLEDVSKLVFRMAAEKAMR